MDGASRRRAGRLGLEALIERVQTGRLRRSKV